MQRARRRNREAEAEQAAIEGQPLPPYEPIWFRKINDEDAEGFDHLMHVTKGTYWDAKKNGDWSQCPSIF